VLYAADVGGEEFWVQSLPTSDVRDELIWELQTGVYSYVAVGSTFADWPTVDNRVRVILQRWPIIWLSDEHRSGPSRLMIYEYPRPTIRAHPVHVPIL
jgi:hypothetical protein